MVKILLADSDLDTLAILENTLKQEGHEVETVREAWRVVSQARQHQPELVILDLELQSGNSLVLCNELRSQPNLTDVPILFLTTKYQVQNVVQALDGGGDDCLSKPFTAKELAARVRALLRRSHRKKQAVRSIEINTYQQEVRVDKSRVDLTPTEFDLLQHLCRHRDDYHNASDLLESVWKYPTGVGDKALVRNHIHNLRRKLEGNKKGIEIIVSLHGRGYRLNANVSYLRPIEDTQPV